MMYSRMQLGLTSISLYPFHQQAKMSDKSQLYAVADCEYTC